MTLFDINKLEDITTNYNVQKGDLFALGKHRILCGDCINKDDVALLMDNAKVDMIFTDSPYNVAYSESFEKFNKRYNKKRQAKVIKNDKMKDEDFVLFISAMLDNIKSYLSEYNSYYMFCSDKCIHLFIKALLNCKYEYSSMLIWNKNNHVFSFKDYHYKHEPILYGWYKKHKFYKKGYYCNTVLDFDRPNKNPLHPTPKPIELIKNSILNSTLENMVVYDGFLGSGSTLIACEKTNRICYGIEIEPEYINYILNSYKQITKIEPVKIN